MTNNVWNEAGKDLRYAVRTLRQNPVFTAACVLTLALGIGANTAIFSLIDTALIRPLPYPDGDRIVALYGRVASGETTALSPATFLDYRSQDDSFAYLAAFRERPYNVTGRDRPERIEGAEVTPDFFAVLGVQAHQGRTLTARADAPGGVRTVVLSYSFWQRRYAADPGVLGQAVPIDGEPHTIVGVMPPYFNYPPRCELWISSHTGAPNRFRAARWTLTANWSREQSPREANRSRRTWEESTCGEWPTRSPEPRSTMCSGASRSGRLLFTGMLG